MRAKLPKVPEGKKRSYVKCKECGRPLYYDYMPYSLSTPLMTLPCGHGIGLHPTNSMTSITRTEFYKLFRGTCPDCLSDDPLMCKVPIKEFHRHMGEAMLCCPNKFHGGAQPLRDDELREAIKHFPKQYLAERLAFDFDSQSGMFEVTGGGFVVAQAEDSEVANAICSILNIVRLR